MNRLDAGKLQSEKDNNHPRPDKAPDIDVRGQQIRDSDVPPKDLHLFTRRNIVLGSGAALAVTLTMKPSHLGKLSPSPTSPDDRVVGQFDHDPEVRRIHRHMKERYGVDFALGPEKDQKEILGRMPSIEKYKITLRVMKE